MDYRCVCLLAAMLFVTSCGIFQQTVDSNTTVFVTPEFKVEGTIAVLASDEKVESSLEFAFYRKKFEEKLVAAGYQVTDVAQAKYIALVAYGIDNGETSIVSTPVFGMRGGYYIGPNYYMMPSYGVVDVINRSVTTFTRAIAMDIVLAESFTAQKIVKVYESRTKSVGGCSVIVEVFDEMLEAMFHEFPSVNARNRNDKVPANINC